MKESKGSHETLEASEDDLLRRMRGGDEQAFLILYRRHQGALFRFALHMSGSRQIAEEVTQDVFLGLLRASTRYDCRRGPLEAYLIGAARHGLRKHFRRREEFEPFDQDCPTHETADRADLLALRQAVLRLPTKYREVILLCDLEELSYEEAAKHLGCALGTVRSRLHRARSVLAKKLVGKQERCPA